MSKFINLDDFNLETQKQFQFNGKTYTIKPLGFGAYISLTSKRQKLAELSDEADPQAIYDIMASIVKTCVPDLTDEDLAQMSVAQLSQLAKFVQEEDEETQAVTEEIEGN